MRIMRSKSLHSSRRQGFFCITRHHLRMGIKSFVRLFLENEMTPKAWMPHPPDALRNRRRVVYAIEDNMHIIKTMKARHEGVRTVDSLKKEIVEHHLARMNRRHLSVQKYISLFDRWVHPIKAAVEHTKRDEGIDMWPDPAQGELIFDESKPHDILSVLEPENWRRFCRSRHLVRRHLYPLIFNAFIDPAYVSLAPGQLIILHGIPGAWKMVPRKDIPAWVQDPGASRGPLVDDGTAGERVMPMLVPRGPVTAEEEESDPEVYDRIWIIEGRAGPDGRPYMHYEEWKEAKNSIIEADLAIAFYDKWFPDEDCLVYGNDGDFIPILLGYARERNVAGQWRNHTWLRMPNTRQSDAEAQRKIREDKRKKDIPLLPQEEREEARYMAAKHEFEAMFPGKRYRAPNKNPELFYDINAMWTALHEYNEWGAAGVQNAVLAMIALIIMAGNDFFKNMLPTVSTEKVTNYIWAEFMENPRDYRHLFQLSKQLEPDPRALREPCIDEALFIEFCNRIYLRRYRDKMTKEELEARDKELKAARAAKRAPSPETIHTVRMSLAQKEERRIWNIDKMITRWTKKLKALRQNNAKRDDAQTRKLERDIARQEARRTDPKELTKNRILSSNEIRLMCRRLRAAILYNYNGYRDPDFPDWTRDMNGIPVYGYEPDPDCPGKVVISDVVVRQWPDPVPDIYTRWWLVKRRAEHFANRARRAQLGQDPQGREQVQPPYLLSPTVETDQQEERQRLKQQRQTARRRNAIRPRPLPRIQAATGGRK